MKANKVYLVLIEGRFGSKENYNVNLDTEEICRHLRKEGFFVKYVELRDLIGRAPEEGVIYWCGGHPDIERVRIFLEWVVCAGASFKSIVPCVESFLFYENKGAQTIFANRKNLPIMTQDYHFQYRGNPSYPLVWKDSVGAGGKNVKLVYSDRQLKKIIRLARLKRIQLGDIFSWIKYSLAKELLRTPGARSRYETKINIAPHVIQEFLPGLKYDYKVLNFFGSVYVLRRGVRDGDFRASGSGKFCYVDVDESLLDFSEEFRKASGVPYISLDVAPCGSSWRALEFQAVCFGPYTQLNAPFYYSKDGGCWKKIKGRPSLEHEYSRSFVGFVRSELNDLG